MPVKLGLVFVYGLLCFFSTAESTPIATPLFEQIIESDPAILDNLLSIYHTSQTTHQSLNLCNPEPEKEPPGLTQPSAKIVPKNPTGIFEQQNVARDLSDYLEGMREEDDEPTLKEQKNKKYEKYKSSGRLLWTFGDGNSAYSAPDSGSRGEKKARKLQLIFSDKVDKPRKGYENAKGQNEKKYFLFDKDLRPEAFDFFDKKEKEEKESNSKTHFLFRKDKVGELERLYLAGTESPDAERKFDEFYM